MEEKKDICITAETVKTLAASLGISDTGICSAEADTALLTHLPDGVTPFVPAAEKRIDPRQVLPCAQSVIICAFHYAQPLQENANLSRYAWGKDYHGVVRDYLSRLLDAITERRPETRGYIFTDSSPLCDKALAYRAGLGYFGKNSLLLHPRFGSLFFIGGIVTDLALQPDTPLEGNCGDCNACAAACPVGLCGTGQLDGKRCISYLQQKKGDFNENEAALIRKSGSVWGCDLCQNICPKNRQGIYTTIPEFSVIDTVLPPDLTEADFQENYRNRAFFWRGYRPLRRNLDILYKHSKTPRT